MEQDKSSLTTNKFFIDPDVPKDLDPHQVSKFILDMQITRIKTSPYSAYIPIGAQVAERLKQEARAYARYLKRKEEMELIKFEQRAFSTVDAQNVIPVSPELFDQLRGETTNE